jgi:hypothetical protein
MEGGDGVITLVLGVVTILIGVSQLTATRMPALLQRSSIVTGAITGAMAIYDYVDVQRRIQDVKEQSELVSAPAWVQGSGPSSWAPSWPS